MGGASKAKSKLGGRCEISFADISWEMVDHDLAFSKQDATPEVQ
jgi:GDP-D-mannose dehydratase